MGFGSYFDVLFLFSFVLVDAAAVLLSVCSLFAGRVSSFSVASSSIGGVSSQFNCSVGENSPKVNALSTKRKI